MMRTAGSRLRPTGAGALRFAPIETIWIRRKKARWICFAVMWSVCGNGEALELFDGLEVNGFLSQGYFLTSSNKLFGDSNVGGSLDYTYAGINASWQPLSRLQLSSEILFRRVGKEDEEDILLVYGLADYSFLSTADYRLGVLLGRVRLPLGLYFETYEVPFTRPSILLPQSIYFEQSFELNLSGDGAAFYAEHRATWGNLYLELGGLWPRVDNLNTELALFRGDAPGELDSNLSFIGRLAYEFDGGRLRLALSGARLETDYNPRFPPPNDFAAGTDLFEPIIASAQYNAEHWSLTSEYALRHIEDHGFGPFFPDTSFTGESYYFQGTYRVNPKWEAILRYDVLFFNRDDRDGTKFKAQTGLPANIAFAKDWTVGLRYNIASSLMVRAEYHRVYGTGWLRVQDNPDPTLLEKQWDLFALLLSYRF